MVQIECKTTISISGVVFHSGEIVDVSKETADDLINRKRAILYKNIAVLKEDKKLQSEKSKKKIAIIGTARTKNLAPFGDMSWQIWGLNTKFEHIPRFDRWFDLHCRPKVLYKKDYADFLKRNKEKIVIAEPINELPDAFIYPQKEIMAEFGDFFTNSISWMIALAIYEKADEIGVFGVDMALASEYEYQKPSVIYFLGFAVGRGIKVTIPHYSKILNETSPPLGNGNQKLNTLFYLGVAAGQGVKFLIPKNSDLFKKDFLYWLY